MVKKNTGSSGPGGRYSKPGAGGSQIKKSKVAKGSGASPAQKDRNKIKARQELKKKADVRAEQRVFQNRFKIRGALDKSGKYYEQNSPGGLNDNTYMAKGTTKPGTSTTTKKNKNITSVNRPGKNDNRTVTGTNPPGTGSKTSKKSNFKNKIKILTAKILAGPLLTSAAFATKALYDRYLKSRKK
tara:strand:- start:690 stop:1244 length:555 start_codon:yes stop_codon:yes gene_type:complete